MSRTEIVFRPQRHQVIPELPEALTIIFQAGRGTGKTWNGCRWLLTNALKYPDTRWVAVAQNWRDARRILAEGDGGLRWHIMGDEHNADPLRRRPNVEFVLAGGRWDKAFKAASGGMSLRFANGSEILFASADKPNSLRGLNAHGALADEVAFWPKDSFDMLRLGVRLPLPDGAPPRIFCATTPDGENWLYRRFISSDVVPRPDIAFVGGADGGRLPPSPPPSTFDNRFTDEIWRQQLLAMYQGTAMAEQEIYGLVISQTGAVFKRLGPNVTRAGAGARDWPTPDDCDAVIAGQDLGSENPSSLVVLARKGETWFAVEEVYAPAATESDWHALISSTLERWQPARIYSDRNFPQTTEAQRRRGVPIVLADKRPQSVVDGIRVVQQLFGSDGLIVDTDACPHLWKELRGYRWQTGPDGDPLTPERPVKKDDHAVDALRYACFMEMGRPRRKLLISD
jgi:PBSX family phage terminase large subunit